MKYRHFIKQIDNEAIAAATAAAEQTTSGEICVCITRKPAPDPMAMAINLFEKFNLFLTKERNGVLILIAPESRTTAVYGDEGIDQACGKELWIEVIDLLQAELPDDPTQALIDAIARVGARLAEHFPPREDDIDELPNTPHYH